MFSLDWLDEQYGFGLQFSLAALIYTGGTHMQMAAYTSAEADPGGLSLLFEIPGTFLKVVP